MVMTVRAIEHQPIRGLKRAEYHQLDELGVFRDERVELVFGQVVQMSPIDPSHNESVTRINKFLTIALADRAVVRCQSSFAASDDSEPVPDFVVTAAGAYWHDHPSHAFLVVEVSRSSLRYDRGEKALLYGITHVDEYWIVDLVHGLVEVRRDRHEGEWRSLQTFHRGDTLAMQAFPDVTIAVAEILPPAQPA